MHSDRVNFSGLQTAIGRIAGILEPDECPGSFKLRALE